jgi:hypothetical protein
VSADITGYTTLVTSEHADKPNFVATLGILIQGLADDIQLVGALPNLYDLDLAVGTQEDTVGLWVGITRYLSVPLTGVYFSFDDPLTGLDRGTWLGPFDPTTGLVTLPDEAYRTLLRATVAANAWDGTVDRAYAIWNTLFQGLGFGILIQDNGDMTMYQALTGPAPDAITRALFSSGRLGLKPAGVALTFFTQSVPLTPYFGFDVDNASIGGLDHGAWGIQGSTI